MGSRSRAFVMGALLSVALAAVPAHATMPGTNGKIAFTHDREIWTVNLDGTVEQAVTSTDAANSQQYDWSADGTKLAFAKSDIWVINADGTGLANITNSTTSEQWPSWSPDATRIAFHRSDSNTNTFKIWTADPDGTDQAMLPTDSIRAFEPRWMPDGTRIVFRGCDPNPNCSPQLRIIDVDGTNEQPLAPWGVQPVDIKGDVSPDGTKVVYQDLPPGLSYPHHEIYVQNLDGTNRVRLTTDSHVDREPSWSPDGTKIAFRSGRGGDGPRIYTMNADGSDITVVTNRAGLVPKWQPIPVNAYPRPKGATPAYFALVPAYAECSSPNREHGPPLSFGSCNPPAQASNALTVGTADANGQPANSVATVVLYALPGAAATPADEADVRIDADVTDVYESGSLADYAGDLTGKLGLRITDKLNTPHPGGPGAGTVAEVELEYSIPCKPTADPPAGSTCSLDTSVDALVPGAVPEGKRSIWALGQIEVDDADGAPFMRQGLFVP